VLTVTEVTFIHTTHNTEITFYVEQIFAVTVLPQYKSVVIVGPGNAHQPVLGSLEEVKEAIRQAKASTNRKEP
jgi:hypothetical protein